MPEAAQTEFWRDLKPIEKVFRKHSLEEMFTPDIATDDERFYVPLSETVGTRARSGSRSRRTAGATC